jgi:hypothetical protein
MGVVRTINNSFLVSTSKILFILVEHKNGMYFFLVWIPATIVLCQIFFVFENGSLVSGQMFFLYTFFLDNPVRTLINT